MLVLKRSNKRPPSICHTEAGLFQLDADFIVLRLLTRDTAVICRVMLKVVVFIDSRHEVPITDVLKTVYSAF